MDKDLKTILKEKMRQRRMSTPRLGKRLGIPPDRIYAWYRDDTNPKGPDSLTIQKWIDDESFAVNNEESSNIDAISKNDNSAAYVTAQDQLADNLARALADQAEANKIQAAANDKYAEGFRSLSIILERMESKMAWEKTQATLKIKIDEIAASLEDSKEVDLLAAKHFEEKFVELAKLVLQGRSDKKPPSLGGGNRQGENDGGDHKPRKKRL